MLDTSNESGNDGMFTVMDYSGTREDNYQLVIKQMEHLVEDEPNRIANLANTAALLHQFLEGINWVGFYLLDGDELVLGPFQGLPACVRIPMGKGVCGTAAQRKETIRVADVQQFPGHIACDSASRSEIVVPVIKDGELLGVLDIDSPGEDRFDQVDQQWLEQLIARLTEYL